MTLSKQKMYLCIFAMPIRCYCNVMSHKRREKTQRDKWMHSHSCAAFVGADNTGKDDS